MLELYAGLQILTRLRKLQDIKTLKQQKPEISIGMPMWQTFIICHVYKTTTMF